ncbi:hypothetical protein KJZ61_00230 [Candidatus Dependentiae bacterium]|nr:hypothetical protein [Candidatus Dependentiae bacterium]
MKQGFILLEVIIASAIAAMLSMMLLSSVAQLHRSASSIRNIMSVDVRFMLFFRQSIRDVSGVFVPLIAKKTEQKEETQKIELVPIEHVFTTGENTPTRELSFVTTNVLPSYNTGKPHLVRVTYRMEPDPEHQGSYHLLRSEAYDLAYQKADTKKSETHTLIDGVKDLSLEFVAFVEEKKEVSGNQTSQQATTTTPKKKKIIVKQWPSEEIDKKILLPDYVVLSLTLWNNRYTRETRVEYTLPIIAVSKIPETPKTAEQTKPSSPTNQKNPGTPSTSIQQKNTNKAPSTKSTNSFAGRPKLNVGPRPKATRSSHRELLAGMIR